MTRQRKMLLLLLVLLAGLAMLLYRRSEAPLPPGGTFKKVEGGQILETRSGRYFIKENGQVTELPPGDY
jgi:hypothetical protein